MKKLLTILLFITACSPQKREANGYTIIADASGKVIEIQKKSDTLIIDLDKIRHIKIKGHGRVYDLPSNKDLNDAEDDSTFTTQLSQE